MGNRNDAPRTFQFEWRGVLTRGALSTADALVLDDSGPVPTTLAARTPPDGATAVIHSDVQGGEATMTTQLVRDPAAAADARRYRLHLKLVSPKRYWSATDAKGALREYLQKAVVDHRMPDKIAEKLARTRYFVWPATVTMTGMHLDSDTVPVLQPGGMTPEFRNLWDDVGLRIPLDAGTVEQMGCVLAPVPKADDEVVGGAVGTRGQLHIRALFQDAVPDDPSAAVGALRAHIEARVNALVASLWPQTWQLVEQRRFRYFRWKGKVHLKSDGSAAARPTLDPAALRPLVEDWEIADVRSYFNPKIVPEAAQVPFVLPDRAADLRLILWGDYDTADRNRPVPHTLYIDAVFRDDPGPHDDAQKMLLAHQAGMETALFQSFTKTQQLLRETHRRTQAARQERAQESSSECSGIGRRYSKKCRKRLGIS